jgi:hypothetical protein
MPKTEAARLSSPLLLFEVLELGSKLDELSLEPCDLAFDRRYSRFDAVESGLDAVESHLDAIESHLDAVQSHLDGVEFDLNEPAKVEEYLENLLRQIALRTGLMREV